MNWLKNFLKELIGFAKKHKQEFFLAWFVSLVLVFFAFFALGWVPRWNPNSDSNASSSVSAKEPAVLHDDPNFKVTDPSDPSYVEPTRIVIDKVQLDTSVLNPNTTKVSALDDALTKGVVHYPGSGGLNDTSNMLFFGHSSHLAHVNNQNYKVFNGLPLLNIGDEIKVYSANQVYIYKVSLVRAVSAEEALIKFSSNKKKITLSTCNTFGQKSDRFVVEAEFASVKNLN